MWEGIRRTRGAPAEQALSLMPPLLWHCLDDTPSVNADGTPNLAGLRDQAGCWSSLLRSTANTSSPTTWTYEERETENDTHESRHRQRDRHGRRRQNRHRPNRLLRPLATGRVRHLRAPLGPIRPGHRPPNQTRLTRLPRTIRTHIRRMADNAAVELRI